MRSIGRMAALAFSLAAAACNQSGSDNVMAPSANALDPAAVDAALGPEETNATEPGADAINAVDENSSGEE